MIQRAVFTEPMMTYPTSVCLFHFYFFFTLVTFHKYPHRELNPDLRFRRPLLYPLSYGDIKSGRVDLNHRLPLYKNDALTPELLPVNEVCRPDDSQPVVPLNNRSLSENSGVSFSLYYSIVIGNVKRHL